MTMRKILERRLAGRIAVLPKTLILADRAAEIALQRYTGCAGGAVIKEVEVAPRSNQRWLDMAELAEGHAG